MIKKLYVAALLFCGLSLTTLAQQPGPAGRDTLKPGRQIIRENNGKKALPQQLKENQLKDTPVLLNSDSVNVARQSSANKQCRRKKKN